jgi:hypothetical protein
VQYNRVDDAKKIIKEAELSLIFKGNKIGKKTLKKRIDEYSWS